MSELLDTVRDILGCRDTELLCEVHEHYMLQKKLAEKGLWVYDFALPMLCIQVRHPCSLCGFSTALWAAGSVLWVLHPLYPHVAPEPLCHTIVGLTSFAKVAHGGACAATHRAV